MNVENNTTMPTPAQGGVDQTILVLARTPSGDIAFGGRVPVSTLPKVWASLKAAAFYIAGVLTGSILT